MSAEVSVWKGVGDGSALLDLWLSSHCSRGGREACSQWERCPGSACAVMTAVLQTGLLVPQGSVMLLSSASCAMMMFTQEPPSSCIKTSPRAWGSETLSLNLKLRWPACLLQWIARSRVRPGGPGTERLVQVCVRVHV